MATQQRRFERKSVKATFRAQQGAGAGTLHFESADLSEGGAFLKSDLLLEEGEALSLELTVPGHLLKLQAEGRVAWVRRFPQPGEDAGMGVEFSAMTPEAKQALVAFLSAAPTLLPS